MSRRLKISLLVLCAVIVVLSAVSIRINPFLFTPGNPGSFEYIRIGERLADKGRYAEALKFFEKAFESSPESDIIKSSLAWIYTVYARELASYAKHDKSLHYFLKAYEVKRDQYTAQNLAVAHSRRALEKLRSGDWSAGIEGYAKAREIASDYKGVSSNLGVYLYNDAYSEFKAGRETIAVLLLSESFLASESKYPFALLGDIYYKRADLEQAAFYWGKALELDPENKALLEKRDRVSKETELAKSQKRARMAHFELRYDPELAFDVVAVNAALEKAYEKTGKKLGYFPDEKSLVFLYSEEDFRNIFKLSPMVRAFYDGNIRMPLPKGAMAGDELNQYIEHEYAHAVVSAMTDNNCPPWLGEGISVYMQISGQDPRIKDAILRAGDLSNISLDGIDKVFRGGSGVGVDMGAYYILAYTMVEYIIQNFGMESLKGILKRLKTGQHFINAMDDQLLISEAEFVRRWRLYVGKRFL